MKQGPVSGSAIPKASGGPWGRRTPLVFLAFLSLAVAACGWMIPLRGYWVVDSGLRHLQLVNLVDRHGMAGAWIDHPWQAIDPDFRLSPDSQLTPTRGRLMGQYPPTLAYLAAPAYAAFGDAGARAVPLLAWMALLGAMTHLARTLGFRPLGAAVAAGWVACGTPLLPYAFIYWDILPALAGGLWAMALAARARNLRRPAVRLAAAGFAAGSAFALREEYALWAVAIAGIAATGSRPCEARWSMATRFGIYCGGFCAVALPYAAWNMATVGAPLYAIRVGLATEATSTGFSQRLAIVSHHLIQAFESPGIDLAIAAALVSGGVAAGLGVAVPVCDTPRTSAGVGYRGRFALAGALVMLTGAAVIRTRLYVPRFPLAVQKHMVGFVCTAPLTFLGLAALWPSRRDSGCRWHGKTAGLIAAAACSFAAAFVVAAPPATVAAFHFGPRLLLPAATALALLAARPAWNLLTRGVGPAGAATSALVAVAGLIGFADNALYMERLAMKAGVGARTGAYLRSLPPGPILTTVLWLPIDISFLYYERPQMGAWKPGQVSASLAAARAVSPARGYLMTFYFDDPPSDEIRRAADLRELPAASTIGFPDPVFAFRIYELTWKPFPAGVDDSTSGTSANASQNTVPTPAK